MKRRYLIIVTILVLGIGLGIYLLFRKASSPYRGEIIGPVLNPPLILSYETISTKDPFQKFLFNVAADGASVTPVRRFTLAYAWKCDSGHGSGEMTCCGNPITLGHTETVLLEGCRFGNVVESFTMTLKRVEYADGSAWGQ